MGNEMDKDELNTLCNNMIRAVNPGTEPTNHQVHEITNRISVRNNIAEKGTVRDALVDYIVDEFRRLLKSGEIGNLGSFENMLETFSEFDHNGDGHVTSAEFIYVLVHKMVLLSEDEAREIVAAIDTNHDGTIALAEFTKAFMLDRGIQRNYEFADDNERRSSDGAHATSELRYHFSFSPLARSAMMKLRVGAMPRPEDYLNMAALQDGIASICRPSFLAKFDALPQGKVASILTGRSVLRRPKDDIMSLTSSGTQAPRPPPKYLTQTNTEYQKFCGIPLYAKGQTTHTVQQPSNARERKISRPKDNLSQKLMTMLQFIRAKGVPCPDPKLKQVEGNHMRGVRVSMFYAGETVDTRAKGMVETIVGNQYKTLARNEIKDYGTMWQFPDDPEDGMNDGRLMLSADPLTVQEDLDLSERPNLQKDLYVLIELTMLLRRPRHELNSSRSRRRRNREFKGWSASTRPGGRRYAGESKKRRKKRRDRDSESEASDAASGNDDSDDESDGRGSVARERREAVTQMTRMRTISTMAKVVVISPRRAKRAIDETIIVDVEVITMNLTTTLLRSVAVGLRFSCQIYVKVNAK